MNNSLRAYNKTPNTGEIAFSGGSIVRYSPDAPLHITLANKCSTAKDLQELLRVEGNQKLDIYGMAAMIKQGRDEEAAMMIYKVFEILADSERDEALKSAAFFKSFYQAVKENKDFYWLSPTHIALAIKMGTHGRFNDLSKLYGNKITVRHLIGWLYDFMREWTSEMASYQKDERQKYEGSNMERGVKTMAEFLRKFT